MRWSYLPRVSVSVEEGRTEQEVEVAREGANLRLHLPSIPHSWALLVVLVPGVEDLVGILSDEGVGLHCPSQLLHRQEEGRHWWQVKVRDAVDGCSVGCDIVQDKQQSK